MYRLTFLILLLTGLASCGTEPDGPAAATETFDREAMLAHWADDVIVPALRDFAESARHLRAAAQSYAAAPAAEQLPALREAYVDAYVQWQSTSPFMTGPGEELRLRDQVNIYPTDTDRLLAGDTGNLELPSNVNVQGLPAIDFLLFGTDDPADHAAEIARLADRLATLSDEALARWTGGYRDTYVRNSGNSATASVDRTVNDFIYWYEKHLRAGKVGIPAGVFSSAPMTALTEARYHGELSKRLFLEGLATAEAFFTTDPGLKDYLDALGVERDGQLLSERIAANFGAARTAAAGMDDSFAAQVETDNTAMLQLYDALQANTILLKVDMLQALGINVDYVDADGD